MNISWNTKALDELSTQELFSILQLRQDVFVVEQECPYPDIDETDQLAMHCYGLDQNRELIAYARLIKPGVSYPEASIGRVVVAPAARGLKLGKLLMLESLKEMARLYPQQTIKIGAQEHLEKFYTDLGFVRSSAMYIEDGIPHIHMIRSSDANQT